MNEKINSRNIHLSLSILSALASVFVLIYLLTMKSPAFETTKFIGEFPFQYSFIVDKIKDSKESLTLVLDIPAYGCFSDTDEYEEFKNILKILNDKGVKITLITYDAIGREKLFKNQFGIDNENLMIDTSAFKIFSNQYRGKLNYFNQKYHPNKKINTYKDFYLAIAKESSIIEKNVDEVYFLEKEISTFFWLIDDKEAIFSTQILGNVAHEFSLYSNEKDIVILFTDFVEEIVNN